MANDDDGVLGEIRMYAGSKEPPGWKFCGSDAWLDPADYPDLFSLIGNTYGGNGHDSFALPDLRQRAPVHQGAGPGLQPRGLGSYFGAESVALTEAQIPAHPHQLSAAKATEKQPTGDKAEPTGGVWATGSTGDKNYKTVSGLAGTYMAPDCVTPAGNSAPHENMPPFIAINFIICVSGVYPPQP